MNRRPSDLSLQALAACVAALLFVACASQGPKPDEENRGDRRRDKIGVEDFMPGPARVVYARSCGSCHGLDGHGVTAVAPDLYRAKYRPNEEWEKYLRDSADAHPVTNPPPIWLDKEEIKIMAEFLESATRQNQ